jgi:CDP-diacylglycerol--glycerol-3-phosphate 3-phosphatidyltransferase
MSSTARDYQALMRSRLIESRLTPNAISLTGFALCVVAAVLVWQDYFFLGGVAFIVGSVCDTLDGRYSRMSGKGTPFGAFLDSTLDRIEEGVVLTTVAAYFAARDMQFAVAACVVAVLGLLFAKGAGLADFELLAPAVYVLAGLSTITVLQRIFHVRKALTEPAPL